MAKDLSKDETKKHSLNYKNSGVDVEAGDALVDWLQQGESDRSNRPFQKNIISGIGGFASLFRMDFSEYKKPCLVTCTDGVGTKVKLAAQFKNFSGVGQDLVAMCVNDLICTGGKPLMFLDYYAVGQLNLEDAKAFLQSVRQACMDSDCALVGGETAEMPGVYQPGDFDCAGFAVGVVDEEKTIGAHRVQVGDAVVGVSSSGFHSNGYSLLRKVFAEDLDKYQHELLTPTALYVRLAGQLISQLGVHALAHITGGGVENIPRVLPEGVRLNLKAWEFPPLFQEVQKRTGMTTLEMIKTLNCGIGLVVIIPSDKVAACHQIIESQGFKSFDLGFVEKSSQSNTEILWEGEWVGSK